MSDRRRTKILYLEIEDHREAERNHVDAKRIKRAFGGNVRARQENERKCQ